MYLKNIEVQGFKSFAHKIKFEFHNGITAIVGPNGSGKSNVADAVRWVLGEQKVKQLRGGTMQDVIFSGTELRKPLSYATVSITLDNQDHQLQTSFEEVTVTRRLYRSGESEYLLNGRQCRLKDVNELFYDTGIGKEGYSIIGQGQIDKILSGKPEDRRELFDEAAGIVKFKRRKALSLKKLEEEKQNLLRIDDILRELEKQVEPLRKQSEAAKIFLKKKEELKRFDIHIFLLEMETWKAKIREIDKKLEGLKGEMEEVTLQYDASKKEYEQIEEKSDFVEREIERAVRQQNESLLLKQQLENKIEILKEQMRSVFETEGHFQARIQELEENLRENQKEKDRMTQEAEVLSKEILAGEAKEHQEGEKLLEIQNQLLILSEILEKLQNKRLSLLDDKALNTGNIQKYEALLEQALSVQKELKARLYQGEKELEEKTKNISSLEQELLNQRKRLESEESLFRDEKTAYEVVIRELQEGYQSYQRQKDNCFRLENREESLRNLAERYEGYGNSIRKVMEQKNKETGILGVVSDLLQVEKKYETAIETALGGSIQHIVTEEIDTAQRMIDFLKKNRWGRATFLPLTQIQKGRGIEHPDVLKEKGVIGTADSLPTVSSKFRPLLQFLLGRTLVVDRMETGVFLAKKYKQSLRIVTLEGELFNPGGSITGGTFKHNSNLLGRKREIEELGTELNKANRELLEGKNQIARLEIERDFKQNALKERKERLQSLSMELQAAEWNAQEERKRMQELETRFEDLKQELEAKKKEVQFLGEHQNSAVEEVKISEEEEAVLLKEMQDTSILMDEAKKEEEKKKAEVASLQIQQEKWRQQLEFFKENQRRLEEEREKLESVAQELREDTKKNVGSIQEKEEEIKELEQVIEDSKELQTEMQENILRLKREKEALLQRNKGFLEKRESLQTHIANLDKEMYRLESQKDSSEGQMEKQSEYMWEEYELTYHQAMEEREESLYNLAGIRKHAQEIRTEIKNLGSVNVNAIEEYKEVSKRYEFLKTQHQDLVEGNKKLEEIIGELDSGMKKQFKKEFEKISQEFNQVFRELFGGGKGTLELQEEDNLLETGIRIIAQPPGKKLQNMMQLSGGEKALTAISLLFAIQNLKPSPFCLLDEIEAALDDSNVGRFAKYLHKLTKETQFIVITHRKGTMTAADRLYGITMQEKGVSIPVSVSLLDKELME